MFFIDRCPESLQLLEYSHPKLDGHFLLRAIYRAAMLAMLTSTTRRSLPEATVSTKCLTGTSTWIVGLRTSKQKHGYREALARRNGPVSFRSRLCFLTSTYVSWNCDEFTAAFALEILSTNLMLAFYEIQVLISLAIGQITLLLLLLLLLLLASPTPTCSGCLCRQLCCCCSWLLRHLRTIDLPGNRASSFFCCCS